MERRPKQKMDKTEAYYVHIGYTFANELIKRKRYRTGKQRHVKLKVRPCVQARLDKLWRYWGMALK